MPTKSRDEQIRESIIAGQGVPADDTVLEEAKAAYAASSKYLSDSRRTNRTARGGTGNYNANFNKWDMMLADQRAREEEESIYVVNQQMIQEKVQPKQNLWTIVCVALLFALALVGTVQFFEDFGEEKDSLSEEVYGDELDLPFGISRATYEAMQDEETPQYAAYQWLKADPQFLTYPPERLKQRLAMAIFYFATDGQEWTKKEGVSPTNISLTFQPWLSYNESECTWYSFSQIEESRSMACDEEGNLVHLVLIENNLQGTLPDELSWLSSLRTLDLNGNYIGGPVPTSLGSLPNLEKLSLYHNKFSAEIPSELGLLAPSLNWLILRENFFNGTLPSEIWKLSKLEMLNLGDNDQLVGSFPENLGVLMPNLQELKTTKATQWGGRLPASIGIMTALKELHVHHNQLTGPIPPLPKSLVAFHAPRNQFSGSLPQELPSNLEHLDFGGNKEIQGTIPSTWGKTSLVELKIWETSITGEVPNTLCDTFVLEFDCGTALCGCDCPCEDFAG